MMKNRLKTMGISQKTLADRLGVTQPYVSMMRSGKRPVPESVDIMLTDMERSRRMPSADLASRIRRLGLTQDEFANLVGVSQPYVSMMCSGRSKPSARVLSRLADIEAEVDERVTFWAGMIARNVADISDIHADGLPETLYRIVKTRVTIRTCYV